MKSSFENLDVWKEAFVLTVEVYKVTKKFPADEQFGLTSQLRSASSSVPANIAEGKGRHSDKEFVRFLIIARGSLEECKSHILLAEALDFLSTEDKINLMNKARKVGVLLNGLVEMLLRNAE